MALREIHFNPNSKIPKREEFIWWTNHIRCLYERLLAAAKTGQVEKIIIGAGPKDYVPEEPYDGEHADFLTGGQWPFDFEAWWKADARKRKRMVADRILDVLLEIASVHKWDAKPFQQAHDRIVETGFRLEETDPNGVASPDKKWRAKWHWDFNEDRIAYSALIEDKDGKLVATLPLAESKPNGYWLSDTLGKLKWTAPTRVALLGKNGKERGAAVFKGKANG